MTLMIWTFPEHSITRALPFRVCISCSLRQSRTFNCFCATYIHVCLHSPRSILDLSDLILVHLYHELCIQSQHIFWYECSAKQQPMRGTTLKT